MKKVIAVVLILVVVLSLAACGAEAKTPSEKVAKYVDKNGKELISGLEQAFEASSGMTCDSTIKAEGTGVVINIKVNGLDNLTQEQKDTMQSAYDAMGSSFETSLTSLQEELPEATYMTINVCEADGDVAAVINVGKK